MLLQITNNCEGKCIHCLHNSLPISEVGFQCMDDDTFLRSISFAKSIGSRLLMISGGEPTQHPFWYDLIKYVNFEAKMKFVVASNGMWVVDESYCELMKRVVKFENFLGLQITTHKLYYPNYQMMLEYRDKLEEISPGCTQSFDTQIWMEDLGRARDNEICQKAVEDNPYSMSCLNAHLMFRQAMNVKRIGSMLEEAHQFCKPSVDWKGDIHLSESCLCPSIGNVKDPIRKIYNSGRGAKPCGKCKNFMRFISNSEHRPDLQKARKILEV